MREFLLTVLSVALTAVGFAQPKNTYYTSSTLDGKNGQTLELALKNIVYPHTKRTYAQLWTDFKTTDPGPTDSIPSWYTGSKTDLVYDMYAWMGQFPKFYSDADDNASAAHSQKGGINREHVVPNSWWGGESGNSIAYTDLHHLTPSDGCANNAKGNYALGEYMDGFTLNWPKKTDSYSDSNRDYSPYNDNYYIIADGHNHAGEEHCWNNASHVWEPSSSASYGGSKYLYEPADEYKGDFARMYLYVVCAYEGELTWQTNYMFTSDSQKHHTILPWAKELLLKWHRQDSVSNKERARNNAVYSLQSNRNPFIDYPELVEYIWGNKTSEKFYLANAVSAYSDEYINGGSGGTTTKTLQAIYVSGNATKTTYNVGDEFDYSGLTVTATYSDNTQAYVTADATWTVNNDLSEAGTYDVTVTATYEGKTATKTYSVTVEEEEVEPDPEPVERETVTIYENTFLESANGFTEDLKSTTGTFTSIWTQTSSYGMKATAYVNPKRYAAESWLISPTFDATALDSIRLKFDHTGQKFGTMTDEATLWVKVEDGNWQQVTINTYMTGSDWNFVENINELSVAGKKFQIAFKYASSTSNAGTWEIKNLSLTGTVALTGDINLDGKVDRDDVTALTRIIMGTWEGNHGKADVNGDGKVNVADLAKLIDMVKK